MRDSWGILAHGVCVQREAPFAFLGVCPVRSPNLSQSPVPHTKASLIYLISKLLEPIRWTISLQFLLQGGRWVKAAPVTQAPNLGLPWRSPVDPSAWLVHSVGPLWPPSPVWMAPVSSPVLDADEFTHSQRHHVILLLATRRWLSLFLPTQHVVYRHTFLPQVLCTFGSSSLEPAFPGYLST